MRRRPYTPGLAEALPHRRRALARRARLAPRPRARAQGRRAPLARARRPLGRAAVREALDPHAHVDRGRRVRAGRPPDGAARGRAAAHARRVGARHRARVLPPRRGDRPADRSDERLDELAEHATVPVVNLLSPLHHPCQALADLMTLREAFGDDRGPAARLRRRRQQRRALAGDPRRARRRRGRGRRADGLPARGRARRAAHRAIPAEAVAGADAVYTDVWVSMSDPTTRPPARREALAPYRLDDALLDRAAPGAFALHCLPAHPGEEITEGGALRRRAAHLGPGREPPPRLRRRCSSWLARGSVRGHAHQQVIRPRLASRRRPARKATSTPRAIRPEAARAAQRFLDPREVVVRHARAAAGGARRGRSPAGA